MLLLSIVRSLFSRMRISTQYSTKIVTTISQNYGRSCRKSKRERERVRKRERDRARVKIILFAEMSKNKHDDHSHLKILVNATEYLSLLNLRKSIQLKEQKINARLASENKSSQVNANQQPENSTNLSKKDDDVVQVGGGAETNTNFTPELINQISNVITNQLKSQFKLEPLIPNNSQIGQGESDFITNYPEEIPNVVPQNAVELLPSSSVVHKSKLSDSFDDEKLLKVVPKHFHPKALKLLNELKKRPDEITWTSNGAVFINQASLPNSNIFIIFPKLFVKTNHPEKIPYLFEVSSEISSLGFGHLISRSLISGLARRRPIKNQHELKLKINNSKRWYFLGE